MHMRVRAYCEFVTCHTRACCIYILLISDHGYIRIFLKSSFWIRNPRNKVFIRTVYGEMLLRTRDFSSERRLNVCKIRCKGCLCGFLVYNLPAEKNSGREFLSENDLRTCRYFRDDIKTFDRLFLLSVKNRVVCAIACYCNTFISVVKRTQMSNEMHPLGLGRESRCSVESFVSCEELVNLFSPRNDPR